MTEEEIKALQDTNATLVERVTQLESINVDLVEQKKLFKSKLEDGLSDDEAKAEIANLKALLDNANGEQDSLRSEHDNQINSMRMRDVLRDAGVNAQNSDAMEALSSLVLDGASYEDGFLWKNEDGSTVYNSDNKPYGVIDRVNELREGNKSYLFEAKVGGGGGNPPATPSPKNLVRTKMSIAEQVDFRATHGEEAYMALPII